jgi:hypothetical protein
LAEGGLSASRDLTCRVPSSASTCPGTPTGAQLSYDAEGRLFTWQNGTNTTADLYDSGGKLPAAAVNGTVSYLAATGLAYSSDRTLAIWRSKLTQQWSRFILWSR